MRRLSGINFNYTYRLHFVLVSRTYFDKNLIYPEIQAARILIKLKSSWQISSTPPSPLQLGTKEYCIKYNSKYTNSCYVFSFLHNFKLKPEVIIEKMRWGRGCKISWNWLSAKFSFAFYVFINSQICQKHYIYARIFFIFLKNILKQTWMKFF